MSKIIKLPLAKKTILIEVEEGRKLHNIFIDPSNDLKYISVNIDGNECFSQNL